MWSNTVLCLIYCSSNFLMIHKVIKAVTVLACLIIVSIDSYNFSFCLLLSFSLIDKMYQTLNSPKVFKNILLHVLFSTLFLEINLRTLSHWVKIMFQSGGLKGNVFYKKTLLFSHVAEWCCVVLESSGIFVNHSHMTLMIKWILMFLLARMVTVMTGVFSNTQQKLTLLLSSQKNMIVTLRSLFRYQGCRWPGS